VFESNIIYFQGIDLRTPIAGAGQESLKRLANKAMLGGAEHEHQRATFAGED
jgi:hypothetical protein